MTVPLRILVPVKRVIDYAVGSPFPSFAFRSAPPFNSPLSLSLPPLPPPPARLLRCNAPPKNPLHPFLLVSPIRFS